MCSLNDDVEPCYNFSSPTKSKQRQSIMCRSCANRAQVLLHKKDAYCRYCFLSTEIHKFRAALGKSKLMKPQDNVLMAFSGSQSSVALIHLLNLGVTEKYHKKLMFNICILYIEEGILYNQNISDRIKEVEKVREIVSQYDFQLYITTISECFCKEPMINSVLKINCENDLKLKTLFDNIKISSHKEVWLYHLRKQLLLSCAAALKCNKIFTSEVGTDLAVKLLSSFSLGRGDQAASETSFCDNRPDGCIILRPLRDFLKKEIVYYNRFNHLNFLISPSFTTKSQLNSSIQKLTENFVMGLQQEFPSTIYTIFRTGEKLSVDIGDGGNKIGICFICGNMSKRTSLLTRMAKGYTAVDALNFSKGLSQVKVHGEEQKERNCCGSCLHDNASSACATKMEQIENLLCYGCTLLINDLESIDYLPKEIVDSAVHRKNMEHMREQISEFLIEDS